MVKESRFLLNDALVGDSAREFQSRQLLDVMIYSRKVLVQKHIFTEARSNGIDLGLVKTSNSCFVRNISSV